MTKKKGVKGGRTPKICTVEDYQLAFKFLTNQWTIPEDWKSDKKKNYVAKMKQFVVLDNGKLGDWPNGPQIYVRSKIEGDIAGTAKLYVPEWHKKTILDKHHGVRTKDIHLRRSWLHFLEPQSTRPIF